VFGVGSKIDLVSEYLAKQQAESPQIHVHGYSPLFTVDKMFNGIFDSVSDFLKVEFSTRKNTMERIRIMGQKLGDAEIFPYKSLFIAVHKIDAKALQNQDVLDYLAVMAGIPKVRFVMTFDNFRYLTLLDPITSEKLKLVHFNYNTEVTNYEEMKFEENKMKTKLESEYKSLCYIYKSLTQNQKDILKILA
jgi:hypothetical protein